MIDRRCYLNNLAICLVLLASFESSAIFGQSSNPQDEKPQPLVIQTVPTAELKKFLTTERPVRRAVFDEFLRSRDVKKRNDADGPGVIQIRKASYEAKLSSQGILEGTARIEIINSDSKSIPLLTPDFLMSMRSPKWKDRDDPVIWGLGSDKSPVLLTPQSGELVFSWSARSSGGGIDQLNFELGLLRAASTDFTFLAPRKWTATLDGNKSTEPNTDEAGLVQHNFKLGAARRVHLRFESAATIPATHPTYWVRQTTRLDVARQGIEFVADLEIEPEGQPLSVLPLRIDSQLQLLSAKMGDQPIAWSILNEGKEQIAELQFAPPLVMSGRKLRLEARASLVEGNMFNLPQIRPLNSGWREADIELHVAPPLEVSGIELDGAKLADAGPVNSTRGGETRRFRLNKSSGVVRCAFQAPEFKGRVRYGTQLDINETNFELEARVQLNVESGESHDLFSTIPAGWVVDKVESTPLSVIENWTVTAKETNQQLWLRLSRAANSKSPLALRITAHLPRVGTEIISTKSLFLASFDNTTLDAGFLTLNPAPGIRADVIDDDATRLNQVALASTDIELLPESPKSAIYLLSTERSFAISPVISEAEFHAHAASRILLEPNRIISRHRLTISPQRRPLDRLMIRFRSGIAGAVSFVLEPSSNQPISARRASSDPQGELWELRFPEPFNSEFTVIATDIASPNANAKNRLRTVVCEGAAAQESSMHLFSTSDQNWEVDFDGAHLLAEKVVPPKSSIELASLLYSLSDDPQIEVGRKDVKNDASRLWAWLENRVTLASAEDEQVHETEFKLESHAAFEANFHLPVDSRLRLVRLNGEVIDSYRLNGQSLYVPLLSTQSEQTLQIRVASKRTASGLTTTPLEWRGVLPQFPVLSRQWKIWTPPGWAVETRDPWNNLLGCLRLFRRPPSKNDEDWISIWFKSNKTILNETDSLDEPQLRISSWQSTPIKLTASGEPSVIQFGEFRWRLAGWSAAIFSLLSSYSLLTGNNWSKGFAFATTLGCVIACCLVSAPIQMLLSGGFLGGILGALLFSLIRFRPKAKTGAVIILSPSRIMISAIAWLCWCPYFLGQSPLEPPAKGHSVRSRNIIDPVDTQGAPAGDFVYVSPELFEEMVLITPTHQSEPCLLQSIRYRASRANDPESGFVLLSAEFNFFGGAEAQIVTLPVNRNETPFANAVCYVDGERRIISPIREDRSPQVELQGRGAHIVQLNLRVPLRGEKDSSLAIWKALPLGNQTIEIETDSSIAWSVDGELVNHNPVSRKAEVTITPGREIKLGLRRIATTNTVPEISLRLDSWLTLGSGSIIAEYLVRVAPDSSSNSILFELDEGMSLDSIFGPNRRSITPVSLGERRYRAPLETSAAEDATFRILCSAKSSLGLDRLISTGISFPQAKVASTRVGVTTSPDHSLFVEPRIGMQEISVAEFAQGWPIEKLSPQLAINVEANQEWRIDVRSKMPQFAASLQTEYVVHPSHMRILWESDVKSGDEPVSLYTVQVPASFKIDSVSVTEGATNRLVRFARTSPERISLFMRTAALDPRHIQIEGSFPFDSAAPVSLPAIMLEDAFPNSQSIRVFRGYDAQAELGNLKGLTKFEQAPMSGAASSTLAPQSSRFLGSFEAPFSAQAWEAQIAVSTNVVQMSHESTAQIERKNSKWSLRQDIKIDVGSGLLDEVEFELPPSLNEPLEIEPSEPFRTIRMEDKSTRLIISPTRPWKANCELRLKGDFGFDSGSSDLALAPARLLHSTLHNGLISATKQADNREFTWKSDTAEEIPPPENVANASSYQWFSQKSAPTTIRLQQTLSTSTSPAPTMQADIVFSEDKFVASLIWYWGTTPNHEVTLSVQEDVQVVRVQVIGSSSRVSQLNERSWQLASTPGAAPPALEVICTGSYSLGKTLLLPIIDGLPIRQSIFTFHHPQDIAPGNTMRESMVSQNNAILTKLLRLDQIKREAQSILPTLGKQESALWRRNWVSQWDDLRAMASFESRTGAASDASTSWLREADADRAKLMSGIETTPVVVGAENKSTPGIAVILAIAQGKSIEMREVTHFLNLQSPQSLTFERQQRLMTAFDFVLSSIENAPWLVSIGAGGFLLLLFLGSSPKRRSAVMTVAPGAAWASLGTAWWFWFSPVWFGPLVAGAAVLFLLGSFTRRPSPLNRRLM